MGLVNVTVVMIASGVRSRNSYQVLVKHHDNFSDEKNTPRHHYRQQ